MSRCLRWKSKRGNQSDEPLPDAIAELEVTIVRLTARDKIRLRLLRITVAAALADKFEAMCTFIACLSRRNRGLLKQALREHELVLWCPNTNTELKV